MHINEPQTRLVIQLHNELHLSLLDSIYLSVHPLSLSTLLQGVCQ